MPDPPDLPSLREAIEEIDHEILAHLRRRMSLVEEVAAAKLRSAVPFRDEPREDQILQRVRHAAVEQGLDAHEVERLYRVILDMSVAHQKAHVRSLDATPLRVAYQGVEGSYSHITAQRRYAGLPEGVLLEGFESFRAAAEAVLRRGIQSQEGNYTRFVELARDPVRFSPEIPAKTSLLLTTLHAPGALAEVLGVFSRRGVNLAKLESRPIPGSPFKYQFYLDLDGNADRDPVRGALGEVRPLTAELRMLGTYPAAERESSP